MLTVLGSQRRPRHHWPRVYSAVFAGGDMAHGKVVGASDRPGGEVSETPVSPEDIPATAFHLLGIDPHTRVPDSLVRPMPIAGAGEVWAQLLA